MNEAAPSSLPAPFEALRELATGYQKMSSVLLALIFKEYKGRSAKGLMSIIGSLIQPLLRVLIFSFVWYWTGKSLLNGVEAVLYIAAGVFCSMVSLTVMRKLPNAIENNQGLLGFPQVKPIDTILARFVAEMMLLIISYGSLLFILYWFFDISEHVRQPVHLIGMCMLTLLMALGVGLLVGVYSHLSDSVRVLIRFSSLPIFFTSGAVHPVSGLSTYARELLSWNPLLHVIDYVRHYWFGTRLIPEADIYYVIYFTLICLGFGAISYQHYRIQLVQR